MIFTTSWDDGYALDLKIAELLSERGMQGTFYICPRRQHQLPMLSVQATQILSREFEIGAHSLTHRPLTTCGDVELMNELQGSKNWIEEISGIPCTMFCYPFGAHDERVREAVKKIGFRGARTTERLQFKASDPYLLPISLQIAPFPLRQSFRPLWKMFDPLGPLRAHFLRLTTLRVPVSALLSWRTLAIHLFDYALETAQPFFHLYGHSSEVERFGMWEDLEAFLDHVKGRSGVEHGQNSALCE